MTRYLVLSDLHLADIEEHDDGWKAHKARRHTYDDALAETIARFADDGDGDDDGRAARDERRVLVLNGDTLDFDLVSAVPDADERAPFSVSRRERRVGLDATASKSAWKARRVLADHPFFVEALARFVSASARHELVIIAGNHDPELVFDEVQAAVREALRAAGAREADVEARVRFERWFYMVPGEIYVEHGQQYDVYCAQRFVLSPTLESPGREREVTISMGDLSNRLLLGRMGTFNPHASDYILGALSYVGHWLRHYAFTRRSLIGAWILGSLAVLRRMLAGEEVTRESSGLSARVWDELQAVLRT